MKTSDTIAKIGAALAKAQGEMSGAKKSSANPFFKSNYSDLSEVIAAISGPLSANQISYVQSAGFSDGKISVITRLIHSSGEWIESDPCELPPVKNDPQAYGSAITYAKRYSLQALAGVPSVDDDGNAAVKAVAPQKRVNKKLVQTYVQNFVQAIESEDALAIREMGDELKDTPEHDAVWQALDSKQKEAVKALLHELKQQEAA